MNVAARKSTRYSVAKFLAQQRVADDKPPSAEVLNETMRIGRGFRFAVVLPPESDAHYAGAGASLGDAGEPIFWYRLADSAN